MQGFERALFDFIDEGLSALGEESKLVPYNLLDTYFEIKKSEIVVERMFSTMPMNAFSAQVESSFKGFFEEN